MKEKRFCSNCQEWLLQQAFYKSKATAYCKECHCEITAINGLSRRWRGREDELMLRIKRLTKTYEKLKHR